MSWKVGVLMLAAAAAWGQPVSSYKELEKRYPPLKEIKIPEVATHTLPNGLRVYLVEDHTLPIVSGRALIRTGNLFDPPDKIGLADITGAVLRTGGTTSKSGDELDQELERMAASVETGIGETEGEAQFFTLKENLDKVLAIYADLLMHPAFRQDKIDLHKNQTRSVIARRNDDPAGIVRREFANLVYGKDNPYGWQQEYEHVDRIEKKDLEQFYRRYFFPGNVILAVYGDFSTEEMKKKVEAAFQGWNNPQQPVPPFPAVKQGAQGGVYLVTKDDVNQANIRMGHRGGVLKDEDYPALEVMADILGGGGFRSRLVAKVRTQLGYAYSVGARWGANYGHPGLFFAAAGTKSDSTVKAIQAIREEIARLRQEEVTEAELKTAKDTVVNSFVFNFDTRSKTLQRLLRYEYWGYPKDFIFQYKKKLEAVTKADVLRVAQKYLKPEEMVLVVVGKPGDFDSPLASLGQPVQPLDITIPQPQQERAQADAGSLAAGKAVLAKAQKAAGGAEKLAALKDVTITSKAQLSGPMGSMSVEQKIRIVYPSTMRQENVLPFGKIEVFTDGKAGWMKTPQGQMPIPGPQLQQARGEIFRFTETLLLSDRLEGRTVNFVRKDKVGDREAEVIEISSADGNQVSVFVDAATGQILKKQYQGMAMAGPASKVEELYEDFREVAGVRAPFQTVVYQNEKKFAEMVYAEIQYNTGLTAEELAKP
jgi:zinc protease